MCQKLSVCILSLKQKALILYVTHSMKKIGAVLFIYLFTGTCNFAFAQDTLFTHSGLILPVTILKVTDNRVKYILAKGADTLLKNVDKREFAKIRYSNGRREVFGPDPDYELQKRVEEEKRKKKEAWLRDTVAQQNYYSRLVCFSIGPAYSQIASNFNAPGGNIGLLIAKRNLAISSSVVFCNSVDSSNTSSLGYLSVSFGRAFKKPHFFGSIAGGLSIVLFEGFRWATALRWQGGGGNGPGHFFSYKYKENLHYYNGFGFPLELKCFWLSKKGFGGGFTLAANVCVLSIVTTKQEGQSGGIPLVACLNFSYRFTN